MWEQANAGRVLTWQQARLTQQHNYCSSLNTTGSMTSCLHVARDESCQESRNVINGASPTRLHGREYYCQAGLINCHTEGSRSYHTIHNHGQNHNQLLLLLFHLRDSLNFRGFPHSLGKKYCDNTSYQTTLILFHIFNNYYSLKTYRRFELFQCLVSRW